MIHHESEAFQEQVEFRDRIERDLVKDKLPAALASLAKRYGIEADIEHGQPHPEMSADGRLYSGASGFEYKMLAYYSEQLGATGYCVEVADIDTQPLDELDEEGWTMVSGLLSTLDQDTTLVDIGYFRGIMNGTAEPEVEHVITRETRYQYRADDWYETVTAKSFHEIYIDGLLIESMALGRHLDEEADIQVQGDYSDEQVQAELARIHSERMNSVVEIEDLRKIESALTKLGLN